MGWPQPGQVQPMRQAILSVFFGGVPKYNAQEGGFPNQNRVQSPRHTVLLFWGAPPHHIVDSDYVEGLWNPTH